LSFYSTTALTSLDDTWTTPRGFYDRLHEEFDFGLDAAAVQSSALCDQWYGPDNPDTSRRDALVRDWAKDAAGRAIWLNPPYGRTMKDWVKKASLESRRGGSLFVLCLLVLIQPGGGTTA
jgi:site-specific DNA-methyltransferase (adenine-specific)